MHFSISRIIIKAVKFSLFDNQNFLLYHCFWKRWPKKIENTQRSCRYPHLNKQIHDNMVIRLILSIVLTNHWKNNKTNDINIKYSLKSLNIPLNNCFSLIFNISRIQYRQTKIQVSQIFYTEVLLYYSLSGTKHHYY